jgi:hypothetical protein
MWNPTRTVVLLVTLVLAALPAAGQQLPAASPESVGLSSARPQRALVYHAILAPVGTAPSPPAANKPRRTGNTQ